eukprot:458184-Rhodomonas_salina.3
MHLPITPISRADPRHPHTTTSAHGRGRETAPLRETRACRAVIWRSAVPTPPGSSIRCVSTGHCVVDA